MKLRTEWSDVEKTSKEIEKAFRAWRFHNLIVTHGDGYSEEDLFGLPYTSSSEYAALWNVNAQAEYVYCREWRFNALAVSEDGYFVAVFKHKEDTFKSMQIVIGKESK